MAKQHYQATEVRQREIASAALSVIAEEGLRGFTVRAVAAGLEITDGTIFRHFANKQEIVIAAMDLLEERLFPNEEPEGTPRARLEQLFRRRAELLGGPDAVGRLIFSDDLVHAGGAQAQATFARWTRRTRAEVGAALHEHGNGVGGLSVEQRTRLFLGAIVTFSMERTATGGPLDDLESKIDDAWASVEAVVLGPS